MRNNEDIMEIDLLEVLSILREKILIIILCAIIGAGGAGAYSFFLATPIYDSTAKLYVLTQSTSLTSFADIQISSSLALDYQEMIKSRVVISQVNDSLGLDYEYEELVDMVSIENPNNTRILNITVSSPDREESKRIANELANVAREQISQIMDTDPPELFERAILAKSPSKPNKTKNIALGLLTGIILSSFVVILQYTLRDTITTEEDVERKLDLNVLASIPKSRNSSGTNSAKKSKKRGRKNK